MEERSHFLVVLFSNGVTNKTIYFKGTNIEKPREKLFLKGANALSDAELLALLLNTGTKDENVVQLAGRMLNEKGGLKGLFLNDCPLDMKGIKESKISTILACKEILRRLPSKNYDVIDTSEKAYLKCKNVFLGKESEVLVVLYLNRYKEFLYQENFDFCFSSKVIVPENNIYKTAIRLDASFVLLIHNHPSNDLTPSLSDIHFTTQLCRKLSYLQIMLLDSLIIGTNRYFSFRDNQIEPYNY